MGAERPLCRAGIVAQAIGGGGINLNGLNGVDLLNLTHRQTSVPSRGETDSNRCR
jgi:hypothetical protein